MSTLHEIRTVKCANCGILRQERNHWFLASVEGDRFHCVPLSSKTGKQSSDGPSLHGRGGLKKNQQPACGQQCAQKLFERYLDSAATRPRSGLGVNHTEASLTTAEAEV